QQRGITFSYAGLSSCSAQHAERLTVERPARGLTVMRPARCAVNGREDYAHVAENKNLQTPANRRMKAFKSTSVPHSRNRLASSCSLTEKLPALRWKGEGTSTAKPVSLLRT